MVEVYDDIEEGVDIDLEGDNVTLEVRGDIKKGVNIDLEGDNATLEVRGDIEEARITISARHLAGYRRQGEISTQADITLVTESAAGR